MPVTPLVSNPHVRENTGRVAVTRGPLVYCLEGVDLPKDVSPADVSLLINQQAARGFDVIEQPESAGRRHGHPRPGPGGVGEGGRPAVTGRGRESRPHRPPPVESTSC